MRISNQTPVNSTEPTTSSTTRSENATPGVPASTAAAQPGTPSASPTASTQDFSMVSFELQNLSASLGEVPAVRQDVVNETVRRLAAGDLQTPNALQQTANAILGQ